MIDPNLDELAEELAEFAEPEKKNGRPPREERIIEGFEEIQRFVEKTGHAPHHGEDRDIFERLYAVRLDRLRMFEECRTILAARDHQGLLTGGHPADARVESIDEDELMAELAGAVGDSAITELRHVRASIEKRAAEEIANRAVCVDFDTFKPLFERVQTELKSGVRQSLPVDKMDEIKLTKIQQGQFFIIGGQVAYVAEVGADFKTEYDRRDSRLRVIYDNGTESNLLARSFQRSLYPDKDNAGRLITNPDTGPLFADDQTEGDLASGTVYVLRSKSDNPVVSANRDILHKIGVTGGKIETRLANACLNATFLLADVEVVATYVLYNVNRVKLENLIHRVFDPAQLEIEIRDRFGNPVKPREWFLVPLFVVDEAVERIKNGTITQFVYDPHTASLVKTNSNSNSGDKPPGKAP